MIFRGTIAYGWCSKHDKNPILKRYSIYYAIPPIIEILPFFYTDRFINAISSFLPNHQTRSHFILNDFRSSLARQSI
ncbi:hypothetical protein HNQ56_003313 [Anaerotaenia torta]